MFQDEFEGILKTFSPEVELVLEQSHKVMETFFHIKHKILMEIIKNI